jgi:glycosyltransferase involved in cell wall biosynthesis
MRIAQVSPLNESVPPHGDGGTERMVSHLTEELVRQGHRVTLFASGDSVTQADLVAVRAEALRADADRAEALASHLVLLEEVFRQAHRFDLIHFHLSALHYPFLKRQPQPHLTTLHGGLDLPELPALYRDYPHLPVVSLSDAQRDPLPWLNWRGTVSPGLPADLFTFREHPGDYLAFLGRVSPQNELDRALRIAEGCGLPLKAEFIDEVGGEERDEFLGNARALLYPSNEPEPFTPVLLEALACGTPVIAFPCGCVPEVIEDGVNGFVVPDVEGAVAAVNYLDQIDRRRCRRIFEERFLVERMAQEYVAIYEGLAKGRTTVRAHTPHYYEMLRPPHEPDRLVRKRSPQEIPAP